MWKRLLGSLLALLAGAGLAPAGDWLFDADAAFPLPGSLALALGRGSKTRLGACSFMGPYR